MPRLPDDPQLVRLARYKRTDAPMTQAIGPELLAFYKHSVEKRQVKFGKIADAWMQLVPEILADHCSLESFSKGSLTVIVDSAPHLYELKQLLLAGLQQQLFLAARSSGLRKIILKRGNWCNADQRVEFDVAPRRGKPSKDAAAVPDTRSKRNTTQGR